MKEKKSEIKAKFLEKLKQDMFADDNFGIPEKLGKMKKVVVASNSEEGLKAGVDKAQQILEKKRSMEGESCEECEETPDTMDDKENPESEEELMAKLKEIQAKLASLKK